MNVIDEIQHATKQLSPIQVGEVEFKSRLILAPLAGITTLPYRELMYECGAGGAITELISSHAITYKNSKTLEMLKLAPNERATGIQLFGGDVDIMLKAAKFSEQYGPKFIDINMGCPVKKVVSKGGGAAMMKEPLKIAALLRALRKELSLPFSIKIRLGVNSSSINADEIAKIAEEEGATFVTIHGRTLTQGYSGKSNWEIIESIAEQRSIPIIGNGDLFSKSDILKRLEVTKCRALMLGRGPLKDPLLFLSTVAHDLDVEHYVKIIQRFNDKLNAYYSPRVAQIQLKKHVVWMSAGLPNA